MTEYGPRDLQGAPQLVARPWNDVAQELQSFLARMVDQSTTVNIALENMTVTENIDGSTSVEMDGGGSDDSLMLMGG